MIKNKQSKTKNGKDNRMVKPNIRIIFTPQCKDTTAKSRNYYNKIGNS